MQKFLKNILLPILLLPVAATADAAAALLLALLLAVEFQRFEREYVYIHTF